MSGQYIYGVDWEVKKPLPLWQLTGSHQLRVDITSQFDSRFRLAALRELPESESNALKLLMGRGTIPSVTCGQQGYRGDCETIFSHVGRPGDGWGWYVTNDCHEFPGWSHAISRHPNIRAGEDMSDYATLHPKDGYTVQFHNVPWGIFNRYWRRPINLNNQFHSAKSKSRLGNSPGFALGFPAVGVLCFTSQLTNKDRKCIIADFARMGQPGDSVNKALYAWMTQYARHFRVMSDHDSPFVKDEAELCFTMEWM